MLEAEEWVAIRPVVRADIRTPHFRRLLPLASVTNDAVFIYGALALAYWVRFHLHLGPSFTLKLAFSEYQGLAFLLLAVMMSILTLKGAYQAQLRTDVVDDITRIFSAATTSVAVVVVITFMLHDLAYSRGVILYLWVFLITLVALGRMLFRFVQSHVHRRGWGARRLLVVGASFPGKMLMQSLISRPDLGYEVVGFVDRRGPDRVPDFGRFQRLGTVSDIPALVPALNIDEIVIALPGSAHEEIGPVVQLCETTGVGLKLVPDTFRASLGHVQVDAVAGIPLLDVKRRPLRRTERVIKRSLDILVGSMLALLSLPIVLILGILIKLDSDGTLFIKQERVGKHGRRFSCYKLRTMHRDADKLLAQLLEKNEIQGHMFKMRNDPRLTRVGRYIRRLSLDELPQIWNVVKGDMSLVGPRPPLPAEVVKYEPWQLRRLETTPGMTGLWQVSGRSNLSFEEMVMMDIMYIENWSLRLDFQIVFRTFSAVLLARGAY